MTVALALYVVVITALIAGAAAAVERTLPDPVGVRSVWSLAILLSLAGAVWTITSHHQEIVVVTGRPGVAPARPGTDWWPSAKGAASVTVRIDPRKVTPPVRTGAWLSLPHPPYLIGWRTPLDQLVAPLWLGASASVLLWLAFGIRHWRRASRGWEPAWVDGIPLAVSEDVGPAVVGVLATRIVVPRWLLDLPRDAQRLVVLHEYEHIAAADPLRLALGLAAVIAVPWNLPLWWCVLRLRRAVELDCDARVLARVHRPEAYGELLLQVATRGRAGDEVRRSTRAVPGFRAALLGNPGDLEQRIRALVQRKVSSRRWRVAHAVIGTAAVAAAAWTPVPAAVSFRPMGAVAGTLIVHTARAAEGVTAGTRRERAPANAATLAPRTVTRRAAAAPVPPRDTTPTQHVDSTVASPTVASPEREQQRVVEASRVPSTAMMRQDTAEARRRIAAMRSAMNRLQAAVDQQEKYVGAAVATYYPDYMRRATSRTVIWFVADSSGRVLRTAWDETGLRVFSAEAAHARFSDTSTMEVGSTTVGPVYTTRDGSHVGAAAWIVLRPR